MKKHTEARLEDAIIEHLTTQGGGLVEIEGAIQTATTKHNEFL